MAQTIELLEHSNRMANIGVFQFDVDKQKIYWNDVIKQLHEVSDEFEPTLENVFSFIKEEEKKEYIKAAHINALEKGESFTLEHEIVTSKGNKRHLWVFGKPVFKDGKCVKIYGSIKDITQRKEFETELRHKDLHLNLSEHVVKIGYWRRDILNNIDTWSDNLYEIFEHKKGEKITFDTYMDYVHPDDKSYVTNHIESAFSTKKLLEFSHRILLKSNTVKTVQLIGEVICNRKGEVIEIIGTCQDITSQLSIEQKLKDRNQLLQCAEQLTSIGYWRWKPKTNAVYWSDNLYTMFGQPKDEELSFETYFNFIHPEDQNYVKEKVDASISDLNFYNFTHRIITHKGEIKTIQIIGEVSADTYGNNLELLGTCLDITENKEREQTLLKKNQQLNFAEKLAKIGYWQWNCVTNEIIWSDNLYTMYGHEKSVPLGPETFSSYVHEADKNYISKNTELIIRDKKFHDSTYRIQLKDGTIKTINCVGKVVTNSNGDIVEILGTCQDVTESQKREQEIEQKNQMLNFAEEIANLGHWKLSFITNQIEWSTNLYRIFDVDEDENVDFTTALELVHEEDRAYVEKIRNEIIQTKIFKKHSYRIKTRKGEIKIVEITGKLLFNNGGDIIGMMGTSQDITINRKKEKETLERNRQLNNAERMSMIGSWQWNPKTDEFKWSDNLYRIYGFEVGIEITRELREKRIHPEDKERVYELSLEFLKNKSISKFVNRIILDDGTIKHLETIGEAILDNSGNVNYFMGTIQDVTARLRNDQVILEKNRMLQLAEELSNIGSWKWNIINGELNWSANLYRIFGYKIGFKVNFDHYVTHIHPEDVEYINKTINNIVNTKVFKKFTHRIKRNDGAIRSLEVIGEVKTNSFGEVIELIGSCQDITEQKKAEQKILEANKKLKNSTIELTATNKQLAEFNHITSHNLRSPVSNLNALLGLYKDPFYKNLKEELFQKFEIVIDHLTSTLDTLVESLKVKHEATSAIQKLSFEETLKKTKEILAAEIMQTKAVIKSDFNDVPKIMYNQIYLESIFLNLIGNAMKYKSKDRVPEIEIESKEINGSVYLSFKDNGIGIDLKQHGDKLFGLNKVFHRHPDAKGIGLFLTKAQVEAMGGSISAQSEVNVGSTFTVTLN
ncbi:PAS domain-containing protein [Maribacter confluentis]|uniref:histidine kinase n=1 Tax=Maribacter confluentis TaxID=1656093 RepID=A0ABT8RT28_9FLAO|nr:PAS domain-containing protein [Maribacter confluentis]MDO1513557.1 PAS domain-containing protein [Maribacter confluentis]